MRGAYLGAIVVIAATASYLYLQTLIYHPVVHLAVSGRLSIIALLPPVKNRDDCDRAKTRFTDRFRSCKECKILSTRCDRQLKGLERSLREDEPLAYPVVMSKEMRIAILGPTSAAMAGCRLIVADMATQGEKSATCVPPQSASSTP